MKEYTVIDNVTVASGGTETNSVVLENPGQDLNYAIAVKGGIASADVAVEVKLPGDTEVYDTQLKGSSNLAGMDLTDGGEYRSLEHMPELSALRAAEQVRVTVTNNDASGANATVKIIQFGNE